MKVIRFYEYGGPEVLRYEDAEQPVPGAGQVLVKVAGTSFNPVDGGIRGGYLQQPFPVELPHTPGADLSGTVAALGEGVTGLAVGDPVIALLPLTVDGATAEYTLAPAELLVPAPTNIPLADAAAIPLTALTAWQAVHEHAKVQPGQRVLVNGAGGGVGRWAVQFAKLAGATVVGTAGSGSAEAARSAGADEVLDYAAGPSGEPFDVVVNAAAADEAAMAALVAAIRPGGTLVSTSSPATEDVERKVSTMNMYLRIDATQLAEIARLVDAGQASVLISERRPIAEAGEVHRRAAAGQAHGKVVLYS